MCELDSEIFTCHRCKKQFNHTEGTWLPVGYDYSHQRIEQWYFEGQPVLKVMNAPDSPEWMKEPPVVTMDEFTCYDCLKEGDGDGFLEENSEDNRYYLDATDYHATGKVIDTRQPRMA